MQRRTRSLPPNSKCARPGFQWGGERACLRTLPNTRKIPPSPLSFGASDPETGSTHPSSESQTRQSKTRKWRRSSSALARETGNGVPALQGRTTRLPTRRTPSRSHRARAPGSLLPPTPRWRARTHALLRRRRLDGRRRSAGVPSSRAQPTLFYIALAELRRPRREDTRVRDRTPVRPSLFP